MSVYEAVKMLDQMFVASPIPRRIIPIAPPLRRAHLTQRIDDAMDASRLVLVTAPAGWGKTSLLSAWAHATDRRVAWVSGHDSGDDAIAFFRSLVFSLTPPGEEPDRDVMALLRSSRPMPIGMLLDHLRRVVASDPTLTLVVDDFHLVASNELRQRLFDLAVHGPGNLRVVIASREALPWPLARLRAHGVITEFSSRDLALTKDEIAELLHDVPANRDLIHELADRSEGWPAGLGLARLWYRHGGAAADVPAAFRGTHRDIADYLVEEVIAGLPPGIVQFLLTTSVVGAFSASLAGALSGMNEPEVMIREIERRQLFLIPLDDERAWYRYHGVFRDYLVGRLQQDEPGKERDLLRHASTWHERNGTMPEAVEFALRAGDETRAASLLQRIAERLVLQRGEAHTLIRLAERLSDEVLKRHPSLEQFYAWALVLAGRLDEATALADRAEASLDTSEERAARFRRAEIAGIRARIAAYWRRHDDTIRHALQALDLASPDFDWFRADAVLSLGFAYRSTGRIEEAASAFAEAARHGWHCRFSQAALWGTRYLAATYASQGKLRDAADLVEEGFVQAETAGMDSGGPMAALLISRGEIRFERNDLAGARDDLERALTLAHAAGDAKVLMNAYLALSLVEDARGQHARARELARRAVRVFDGTGEKAHEARIALRHGDVRTVRIWQEEYTSIVGSAPDLCAGEMEQIMLGRALLQSDSARACEFLTTLLTQAENSGRWGLAIVIHALLALAAEATGDEAAAVRHIGTSVELGAEEGYVRSILDEGPSVHAVLRRAAREENSPARRQYMARLLGGSTPVDSPVTGEEGQVPGLIEPLTGRQLEVLRLMVEGKTNREIASLLFVTEGTIKSHAHQIFGKLMARNRAEAIRNAQQLGVVT